VCVRLVDLDHMRGLRTDRAAQVIVSGLAFMQNRRRVHRTRQSDTRFGIACLPTDQAAPTEPAEAPPRTMVASFAVAAVIRVSGRSWQILT
jgi:hypothetical protein